MAPPAQQLLRSYFWIAPILSAIAMVFSVRWLFGVLPDAHIDLEAFRFGAQAWWNGHDIYGVLPPTAAGDPVPFVYPPFALLPLAPLAAVSVDTAALALMVAGFLSIAVTLYVVALRVWPSGGARGAIVLTSAVLPFTVFLEPVVGTFEFGQVGLILMALVTIDCLAPKTPWPRGMAIGIAAAIKLTPLAFLLYFLINKNTRATITTLITLTTTTLTGFLIDFTASTNYWFGGTITNASQAGTVFRHNQAIQPVLLRTGMPEGLAKALWLAAAVALLVLVVVLMRRSTPPMAFVLNAGLILLVSPTSWSHYWVWAIPAIVVMAGQAVYHWKRRTLAAPAWLAAGLLTAAICHLAPFYHVPPINFRLEPSPGVWTLREQILAASYVILALFLLAVYSVPRLRRRKSTDEPTATDESTVPADEPNTSANPKPAEV